MNGMKFIEKIKFRKGNRRSIKKKLDENNKKISFIFKKIFNISD